ncbi:MAG: DUF1616 domain-containing protein [Solirubrobacteraceae bacterium]
MRPRLRSGRWGGGAAQIALGVALLTAASLLPVAPLRALIVLPLSLLLPGWALLRAVTPAGDRRDVGLTIGLSALLSIALLVALALAMSAAAVPIATRNLVIGLDVMLAALALVIHARSSQSSARSPSGAPAAWQPSAPADAGPQGSSARHRAVVVAIAVAVIGATFAALLAAYRALAPVAANDNTWLGLALAGPPAHADAPLNEAPGAQVQLQLTVSNHTRSRQTVRIVVQVDGGVGHATPALVVGRNAGRVTQVALEVPRGAGLHHVVLTVTDGARVPGASVGTWIIVGPAGPKGPKGS